MFDPDLLLKLHKAAPRYTSYPTAPEWISLSSETYSSKLKELAATSLPLSLYFHIPFCKSMCLYCGCSVILNRKPENEERYVDYLCREIDLVCSHLGGRKKVTQLHFGGGTPTKLSIPLFQRLFEKIDAAFEIDYAQEIAIEIDPRTVTEDGGEKLKFLKKLGFNRVSFGVQDTDPRVQEAVKRRQSYEMTKTTYDLARSLGFEAINIDLIYGLPLQTIESFKETTAKILEMRPNRIALFSYAKVPWLKPHQNAIKESSLPSPLEKFEIYVNARKAFLEDGYTAIGMDHFALNDDPLAVCYRNKTLKRNFQGYTAQTTEDLLAFGTTAIGFLRNTYVQALKELPDYYAALDRQELPTYKGKVLTSEDLLRKWVIHTLMCTFELDKKEFESRFEISFDDYFKVDLSSLEEDGLVAQDSHKISVTPLGELFVRLIAMQFDGYVTPSVATPKFSQSI